MGIVCEWWKRIRSAVSLRFPFQSKGRASSSLSLLPLSAPASKPGTSAASASTREVSQVFLFDLGSIVFVYFQSLTIQDVALQQAEEER